MTAKKSTSHFQNKQEGWNPFQTHKESAFQCRRHKRWVLNPWVRSSPWRREWLHIPVFLPGKFHRQRSLVSYSPWGRKESNTTEHTHRHTYTQITKKADRNQKKIYIYTNIQDIFNDFHKLFSKTQDYSVYYIA